MNIRQHWSATTGARRPSVRLTSDELKVMNYLSWYCKLWPQKIPMQAFHQLRDASKSLLLTQQNPNLVSFGKSGLKHHVNLLGSDYNFGSLTTATKVPQTLTFRIYEGISTVFLWFPCNEHARHPAHHTERQGNGSLTTAFTGGTQSGPRQVGRFI